MRIAILQQSYGRFGGAERLFFSHYAHLKRMHKDVTGFYTGRIPVGWSDRLKVEEIQPIPSGISSSFRAFRNLMRFLSRLRDFDRVVVHHHVEPMLAYYISKLMGPKSIWYSGSMFELPWEKVITGIDYRRLSPTVGRTASGFYGPIASKLLLSSPFYGLTTEVARVTDIETVKGYGKVLANSLFLSRFIARVYKLKNNPGVVYPGVDPAFERLSLRPQPTEEDYILAVGSLVPLKNSETIIRAAATFRSSKIVFVGDGQEKSRLKNVAAELDVPIEFWGRSEQESELADAYSRCKFLVLLSLYETFGLTPIEAGLFSKPSIVTDHGGPPEVVMDGVTGFVVNPTDALTVGAKMSALLDDEPLRHAMGRRAREIILEKFTLEKSTTRLLEEIES